MKKFLIFASALLAIIGMSVLPGNTEAQVRRKPAKVRVVKHHTRVVRIHPRVVRRAHIRYTNLPRWGAVVATRPMGAMIIASNYGPYYFHNGIYYMQRQPGFTIVRPAPGIRIRVLPTGYRRIHIGRRPYYYYYGTFYTKADNNNEYIVVDAPEGAIVDALPDGYEIKTIGDTEYYVLDGVYYAEVDTDEIEDGVGYQVVKI
jgi:Family of unknown function (DUF6515)